MNSRSVGVVRIAAALLATPAQCVYLAVDHLRQSVARIFVGAISMWLKSCARSIGR